MNRNISLDGLRAVAAIIVVAYHTKVPFMSNGNIGVDIFFVLSGFLITGLLLHEYEKTKTVNYWQFEWRRIKRLYPAMIFMLMVVWLLSPYLFPKYDRFLEFVLSATYISNWARILSSQPIVTQHTWSLAVEVQFYLIWPIILIGLRVLFDRKLLFALVSLFVLLVLWRLWLQYSGQTAKGRIYSSLDGRAASLVAGSIIAVLPWRPSVKWANIIGVIASGVLLLYAAKIIFIKYRYAYLPALSVELAAAALIMCLTVSNSFVSKILSLQPLPLIGLWSYSLYLWHYPIARLARQSFPPSTAFAITIIVSLILAALSYYLIEMPFNKRRQAKSTSLVSV